MKRIGTLLLSALVGALLLIVWSMLVFPYLNTPLISILAVVVLVASEAVLLHAMQKPNSILWRLASTAGAIGVAIPVAVALFDGRMLFNWIEWTVWVPRFVAVLSPILIPFLVLPPLITEILGRLRSNNRWRRP